MGSPLPIRPLYLHSQCLRELLWTQFSLYAFPRIYFMLVLNLSRASSDWAVPLPENVWCSLWRWWGYRWLGWNWKLEAEKSSFLLAAEWQKMLKGTGMTHWYQPIQRKAELWMAELERFQFTLFYFKWGCRGAHKEQEYSVVFVSITPCCLLLGIETSSLPHMLKRCLAANRGWAFPIHSS